MNRKIITLLLLVILLLQLVSCGSSSPFRKNTGGRETENKTEEQDKEPTRVPGGEDSSPVDASWLPNWSRCQNQADPRHRP